MKLKQSERGCLTGGILLLATYNQVVESALYKGNSTSIKLFDLVLRLKKAELKYGTKILSTHVASLRMITQ